MALRNGVQYASTTTKRCPMHDPACAARVIEQVAARYAPTCGACDCGAQTRLVERLRANPDVEITVLHNTGCASLRPVPFDAAALIESACGRFTRGAHKGQLRGWAEITVVTEGGWKKDGPGERNGHVVLPGRVLSIKISDFSGKTYLEV